MRVDEFTQWTAPSSGRPLSRLDAVAIDIELQKRLHEDAQLRLRMGELLDALFITHGHHELGFSSIGAYGAERAGENARWCQESRALARRLRERNLRYLRGALVSGQVSWSMAEVLSRHAREETELELIGAARGRTVRAMQVALGGGSGAVATEDDSTEESGRRTRRRAATWGELAMLHTSRILVSHLSSANVSDESFLTALLGETESNLAAWREQLGRKGDVGALSMAGRLEVARRALADLHAKVETMSQGALAPVFEDEPAAGEVAHGDEDTGFAPRPLVASSLPSHPAMLDDAITQLAAERSRRIVDDAALALRVLERRMWRRLGFPTLRAYVEARRGMSLSTLEHLATLGRHLRRYPLLARALGAGDIGTEAALLVGRVLGRWSDSMHAAAWVERARARTYRCLREEVSLVLSGLALDPALSRMPPGLEDLEAAAELERRVQSGELYRTLLGARKIGPQISVTLDSPETPTSASSGSALVMSLRLSDELYTHWCEIEAEFRALAGAEASFIAFMCTSLWTTWLPFLEAWDDKWAHVYRRDRHRCQNPVCSRRDVTPHHIVFKANGGGDEAENIVTLCSWCHLHGVHAGRIRVKGRGADLLWEVGRVPLLSVRGRRKRRASESARARTRIRPSRSLQSSSGKTYRS